MRKMLKETKNILFDGYSLKSYSQEGEDMILRRIFERTKQGFYIDVGAHHPMRFSNTYYFYRRGWRGINIDATPGSMKLFNRFRSRDVNLEVPISYKRQILKYYIFNEPALNSFSKELSKTRLKKEEYKIVDTKKLETRTLAEVLNEYIPDNQEIDFLNIDVEGFDLEVLRSNDWEKYKPKVVLVEMLDVILEDLKKAAVYEHMISLGYKLFAKSVKTAIFISSDNV